jgi:GT2 family glycosyltransferase
MSAPTVSVLAATHHDLPLLERALSGIWAIEDPAIELVIVNNDPDQDVVGWAKKRCPDAVVIDMHYDAGYARAMNRAIEASSGEFVLLLDSDLFVDADYVNELLRALAEHPSAGCVGGKLQRYDLARDEPTPIIDSAGLRLGRNRRSIARLEGQPLSNLTAPQDEQVFGVDGAGMLLRREALRDVCLDGEYFDESFFMYKEDIDLCWRLRLLGWEIWWIPNAEGLHGRSSKGLSDRNYVLNARAFHKNEQRKSQLARLHSMKNQWLMLLKNEDASNILRDFPFIAGREFLVLVYNSVFAPRTLTAVAEFARSYPKARANRKAIQARRGVSASAFRRWLG